MTKASKLLLRLFALCAVLAFGLDAKQRLGPVSNCQGLRQHAPAARPRQSRVGGSRRRTSQQAESRYISDGCNDSAKAGTSPVRRAARSNGSRSSMRAPRPTTRNLGDIGSQREAVLQDMARFNCNGAGGGSTATFTQQQSRGNLFQQLFGTFENGLGDGTRPAATRSPARRATRRCAPSACARRTATTGRSASRRLRDYAPERPLHLPGPMPRARCRSLLLRQSRAGPGPDGQPTGPALQIAAAAPSPIARKIDPDAELQAARSATARSTSATPGGRRNER